jgi:uncharacterized protein (TIGR03067 family)
MIPIVLAIAGVIAAGCASNPSSKPQTAAPQTAATQSAAPSTPSKVDSTSLEGKWTGVEITHDNEGPVTLTFTADTMAYQGHEANDWVKGTFSVRENTSPKQFIGVITGAESPDSIGKKVYAIYKIDDGTLTITGAAPGESDFPAEFDSEGTREFVLKRSE